MNRTVIVSVGISAITAVVCFIIYSNNMRYMTTNVGNGRIYKIDRRTGQTVVIVNNLEIPVQPYVVPPGETVEEKAIRLAKTARTGNGYQNNNDYIRDWLGQQKGNLQIVGWEVQRFNDQIYVVKYTYDQGAGPRSFIFEVNIQEEMTRNIINDPALMMKYGFTR